MPKDGFVPAFMARLGGVAPLFSNQVWHNIRRAAHKKGVDLEKHTPEKVFAQAPDTKRPIWIEANKQDTTVLPANHEKYKALFGKYPEKFTVTGHVVDLTCNGGNHAVTAIAEPIAYLRRMCQFWFPIFGLESAPCAKAALAV